MDAFQRVLRPLPSACLTPATNVSPRKLASDSGRKAFADGRTIFFDLAVGLSLFNLEGSWFPSAREKACCCLQ